MFPRKSKIVVVMMEIRVNVEFRSNAFVIITTTTKSLS